MLVTQYFIVRPKSNTGVDQVQYFEWDRSETIFGNFSENVVQGSMGQGETRQEEVKVEAHNPPPKKLRVHDPPPVRPPPLHLCLGAFKHGQLSQFEDDT